MMTPDYSAAQRGDLGILKAAWLRSRLPRIQVTWVMGPFVPFCEVSIRQAQKLARAVGGQIPRAGYELALMRLTSEWLWLNGRMVWLTNQAEDGPSQFVLKVI